MSMASKKISFEESLELAPLSEEELKELQEELESSNYYETCPTVASRNPSL